MVGTQLLKLGYQQGFGQKEQARVDEGWLAAGLRAPMGLYISFIKGQIDLQVLEQAGAMEAEGREAANQACHYSWSSTLTDSYG